MSLVLKKFLITGQICVHLLLKESGLKNLKIRSKFIYLISPNKIYHGFFVDLQSVLKTKKVKFFQLRLKKTSVNKIIIISKKIKTICKAYGVKFIINDSPIIAKKVNLSKDVTFEVSHASRFLDSINAVKKLNGVLSVGLLVEKYKNEKI
mgnify:CR=1 FL=1